jgi:hypothetical protein
MRLAAQAKGGFYPASSEAIKFICSFLTVAPGEGAPAILDPCCGRAEALATIGAELKVDESCLYACELDVNRSIAARGRLPRATVLTETDYLGRRRPGRARSAWPGSTRRSTTSWAAAAAWSTASPRGRRRILRRGASCSCAAPARDRRPATCTSSSCRYFEDLQVVPFPAEHRPFDEVVLFGRRRKARGRGGHAALG